MDYSYPLTVMIHFWLTSSRTKILLVARKYIFTLSYVFTLNRYHSSLVSHNFLAFHLISLPFDLYHQSQKFHFFNEVIHYK